MAAKGNMKITHKKPSELIAYARNPRQNADAVNGLAASIAEFGFQQPIVIDTKNVIIAGHTRLKAAEKLELDKVPCVIASELTPEQVKAYRILDNKLAEKSTWDDELLSLELGDLENYDFEPFEVDFGKLTEPDADTEDDEVPEAPEEPVTRQGDTWSLGRHVLHCGDSTEAGWLFEGKDAQAIITDPPYGVSYVGGTDEALVIENDSLSEEGTKTLFAAALDACLQGLKAGGAVYASVPARPLHLVFCEVLREREIWRQTLTWVKDSLVLGRSDYHYRHEPILYGWKPGGSHKFTDDRTKTTVLEFDRPKASREHPTMKPLALWIELICNSTSPKDTVLDPFLGSGTTLIACERTQRRCIGTEISERYCDVILARYLRETGDNPVRQQDGAVFELPDPEDK